MPARNSGISLSEGNAMDESTDNQPKKPLPQFRRSLDSIPHAPTQPVQSPGIDIRNPPLWLVIVCLAVGIWILMTVYRGFSGNSVRREIIAEQNAHSYITVYTDANAPAAAFMAKIAAIYGLKTDVQPPSGDTLKIGLRNGKILGVDDFLSALSQVPIVDFHPGAPAGTIYLYGVEGCPYAQRARDMLRSRGIPFVDVNLNNPSDPNMEGFEARVTASGFGLHEGTRNPYLEYNNKIYQNPDLYNVIAHIK